MRKQVIILFLVLAQTIVAQTKLVVLTDIHLMAPSLLVNDGSAWRNMLADSRKLHDFCQPLLNEAVERIKTIKPHLVLITGDLTKDGETVSHEYVIKKLDEVKAAGIPSLVIPGNHDISMDGIAVAYDGDHTVPVASPSLEEFAALYADYGYGEGSVFDGLSKTYCCEPINGLVVIGINSGKDATISTETLDWVCKQASEATTAGKKVIVMMHHALNQHVANIELFFDTAIINNADDIRQRLIDAGVKVVLTGHFHTSDIAKDFDKSLTKPIYDIATGSLISYPCHYRELTFSTDLSELKVATGRINSTAGNKAFSLDSAKVRLHSAVFDHTKGIAMSIVRDKYGEKGAAVAELTITPLSSYAADAFIIHAEGDEYKVNTENILEKFKGELINKHVPGWNVLLHSMLTDLSPYGIAGRENQTDDLSLTIDMGLPVPSGIHGVTRSEDSERCYDINGRLLQAPPAKGLYIRGKKKTVRK